MNKTNFFKIKKHMQQKHQLPLMVYVCYSSRVEIYRTRKLCWKCRKACAKWWKALYRTLSVALHGFIFKCMCCVCVMLFSFSFFLLVLNWYLRFIFFLPDVSLLYLFAIYLYKYSHMPHIYIIYWWILKAYSPHFVRMTLIMRVI